jgi:BirA family biotin operon repressor/biotin-[acetyl-CoA-carboxylase] ligase
MGKIIHHHFDVLPSTITYVKEHVKLFDPKGLTLITANEQTAGIGRLKSHWRSPPKVNIYATFCFTFDPKRTDRGNLAQLLSLSVAETLKEHGLKPILKWPNDLLVNEKKIAGTVCETSELDGTLWVFNSVGLNINMPAEELQKIEKPATSMAVELHAIQDIQSILEALKHHVGHDLELFLKKGFGGFISRLRELTDPFRKQTIHFRGQNQSWEGVFDSINDDGSLNLLIDGKLKQFNAGQIV